MMKLLYKLFIRYPFILIIGVPLRLMKVFIIAFLTAIIKLVRNA